MITRTIDPAKKPFTKEDALYSHIADTYFYQKNRPKTHRKKDSQPLQIPAKLLIAPIIFIMGLAVVLTIASTINHKYINYVKNRTHTSRLIRVMNNGMFNTDVVKNYQFRGNAQKEQARSLKGLVFFYNPKKYNWADMSIDFKFPIDVSKRSLRLSARGEVGGEKINVVLKDGDNRSIKLDDVYLSSKWTDKTIRLDGLKSDINLSDIMNLRIESGYAGESSKQLDSLINFKIYIKNINLAKEM